MRVTNNLQSCGRSSLGALKSSPLKILQRRFLP
jgi:hypothetical protein